MNHPQTPSPIPETARRFSLVVTTLVFCLMLAFAVWVTIGAFDNDNTDLLHALGGTLIGVAALTLLTAIRAGWRSGTPFQHGHRFALGLALFGIGASVLVAG